MSHWYGSTPKKSRRKRDSNPGSSALEADALTTGPTRWFPKINKPEFQELFPTFVMHGDGITGRRVQAGFELGIFRSRNTLIIIIIIIIIIIKLARADPKVRHVLTWIPSKQGCTLGMRVYRSISRNSHIKVIKNT